jgi:hypothetical protein
LPWPPGAANADESNIFINRLHIRKYTVIPKRYLGEDTPDGLIILSLLQLFVKINLILCVVLLSQRETTLVLEKHPPFS